MISLAWNLVAFVNGYYAAVSVGILFSSGAYTQAATEFAVRIGIGAAAWAIVGRGQIAQFAGLIVGSSTWY